jgi:hypothetical protein
MTFNAVQNWLRKEPVQPFVVILSNGDRYEVRHPENAALLRTNVIVARPDTDEYAELALLHVASVERLEASEASTDYDRLLKPDRFD